MYPYYVYLKGCMFVLFVQLHPVENQVTLSLFLISRKEVLLTGENSQLAAKFCCLQLVFHLTSALVESIISVHLSSLQINRIILLEE